MPTKQQTIYFKDSVLQVHTFRLQRSRLYIVVLCGLTVLWIPVVKAAQGGQLFQYIVVIEGFIAAPLPILFALVVFWDRTTEQVD